MRGLEVAEQRWRGAPLPAKATSVLAIAALVVGGLFLAPQSAILIHRYRWNQTDFLTSLQSNLDRLGGSQLSGSVQCIDSVSGCGTVLYRMRLEPATGVLSDFLLFGPGDVAVVRETRAQFSAALDQRPPQVIVVTSHLHIDGPDDFLKLDAGLRFKPFSPPTTRSKPSGRRRAKNAGGAGKSSPQAIASTSCAPRRSSHQGAPIKGTRKGTPRPPRDH